MDADSAGVLGRVSEGEWSVEGFEGPHGLDAGDGEFLHCLLHGTKHAIVALVDHFAEDFLVVGLSCRVRGRCPRPKGLATTHLGPRLVLLLEAIVGIVEIDAAEGRCLSASARRAHSLPVTHMTTSSMLDALRRSATSDDESSSMGLSPLVTRMMRRVYLSFLVNSSIMVRATTTPEMASPP